MQPIVSSGVLSPWEPGIFSLAIYVILILAFVVSQLFIAVWLGEKKKTVEKLRPYESGIIPTGLPACVIPSPFIWWPSFFLFLTWKALLFLPGPSPMENSAGRAGCKFHFLSCCCCWASFTSGERGDFDWGPTTQKD